VLKVDRYDPSRADQWNRFVATSRNGTFLFDRRYMDYHKNRFEDLSLVISKDDRIVALLPANRGDGSTLYSHRGLTYGGLIVQPDMTTPLMLDIFAAMAPALRDAAFAHMVYKTVPAIYRRTLGEDDLYALARVGATLLQRDTFSVIALDAPRTVQTRRKRGGAKARKTGVAISPAVALADFWPVLEARLAATHGATPVHSLDEIQRLQKSFPSNITVTAAVLDGEILAGLVLYDTGIVVRAQYIAASDRGQELGALDLLIQETCVRFESSRDYFDLGSSNAADGDGLNLGLIEFKEGFGARTVAHDIYQWDFA
tara:strand:+ start:918 stop:1859 length:942 start_codon:yes stop_codon:yes gene_type:complete